MHLSERHAVLTCFFDTKDINFEEKVKPVVVVLFRFSSHQPKKDEGCIYNRASPHTWYRIIPSHSLSFASASGCSNVEGKECLNIPHKTLTYGKVTSSNAISLLYPSEATSIYKTLSFNKSS